MCEQCCTVGCEYSWVFAFETNTRIFTKALRSSSTTEQTVSVPCTPLYHVKYGPEWFAQLTNMHILFFFFIVDQTLSWRNYGKWYIWMGRTLQVRVSSNYKQKPCRSVRACTKMVVSLITKWVSERRKQYQ